MPYTETGILKDSGSPHWDRLGLNLYNAYKRVQQRVVMVVGNTYIVEKYILLKWLITQKPLS